MTKTKDKFIIEFPKELGMDSIMCKCLELPSISLELREEKIDDTEKIKYTVCGYRWKPMTFILNDNVGPSTSQCIIEWLRLSVNSIQGMILNDEKSYSKDITLKLLDTTGCTISEWKLCDCVLKDINFGELEENNINSVLISMTIQPSYCILKY